MTTITKDYIGGIEYADNTLEAIYNEEGRISMDNGLLRYEYTLKDLPITIGKYRYRFR